MPRVRAPASPGGGRRGRLASVPAVHLAGRRPCRRGNRRHRALLPRARQCLCPAPATRRSRQGPRRAAASWPTTTSARTIAARSGTSSTDLGFDPSSRSRKTWRSPATSSAISPPWRRSCAPSPSLLAVSAWNDHGRPGLACEPEAVYRTDVFPDSAGCRRASGGRSCGPAGPTPSGTTGSATRRCTAGEKRLRPGVSRARTFGRIGVSGGQFFGEHLRHVALNGRPVDFAALDWQMDRQPGAVQAAFARLVASARSVDAAKRWRTSTRAATSGRRGRRSSRRRRIYGCPYDGKGLRRDRDDAGHATRYEERRAARSYRGVATVQRRDRRIFLAPRDSGRHR